MVGQWSVSIGDLLGGSLHGVMQAVDIMLQSSKSREGVREKMVTEKVSYIFKTLLVNERREVKW